MSPSEEIASPTELASIAIDAARPEDERARALVLLRPFHERIARAVMARRGRTDPGLCDDLAAKAEERLRLQGGFDPTKGQYYSYCRRFLRCRLEDELRKQKRVVPLGEEMAGALKSAALPALDLLADAEPLGAGDMDKMGHWSPAVRRLVVLLWSGLWSRVPAESWGRWLGDFGLALPFPPEEMRRLSNQEQIGLLAGALGLTTAAFSSHWYRGRAWLADLTVIREME